MNINSLNVSTTEVKGVSRFTIVVESSKEKIIKVVKGMKQEHIDTSIESQFRYAQWQHWNFKNWIEGTS